MRSTAIDRRALMGSALATLILGRANRALALGDESAELFAAARREADGSYALAVFNGDGTVLRVIPLPERGHDVTIHHTTGQAVGFARRPGNFAIGFNALDQSPPVAFTTPADRHFYGHGAFSPDGRLLYATENDFDGGRGIIGIYDATDSYRRVGEFESGGIGPHELLLMPDGATLAIANGGIETHPDYGRTMLNLGAMQPSLAFVDRRDGRLIARYRLAETLSALSIRHMAIDGGGRVWFGCQHQGADSDTPPLIGVAGPDAAPQLIDRPALSQTMRNYVGSVAASRDGERIATSSPRGGLVAIWSATTRDLIRTVKVADGCGIAGNRGGGFLVSDGYGRVQRLPDDGGASEPVSRSRGVAWDNHLRAL